MSALWQRRLTLEKHRRDLIWWKIMLAREKEIEAKAREIEWLTEFAEMLQGCRPARKLMTATSLLALLALVALLTSCTAPDLAIKPNLPPMPPFEPATARRSAPAAAADVVAPIRSLTLTWTHPDPAIRFNVYTSSVPTLAALKLWTNTPARSVTFPAARPCQFFGVRAVNTAGLESGWATR